MRRTIIVEINEREWAANISLRNAFYQALDNFEQDLHSDVFPHASDDGLCRTLGVKGAQR
mgnify:CR=1 FL=1